MLVKGCVVLHNTVMRENRDSGRLTGTRMELVQEEECNTSILYLPTPFTEEQKRAEALQIADNVENAAEHAALKSALTDNIWNLVGQKVSASDSDDF